MHQKRTSFHFHIFDLPAVTESPNDIIFMGFLIYVIIPRNNTYNRNNTSNFKKHFLKTLRHG